ncbi:MAG: tetratricopeptide repeat protein [Xanthomonadales bacterium]|nr:tetratricopeptide repeat protein [Xanthomonadales bacterium]
MTTSFLLYGLLLVVAALAFLLRPLLQARKSIWIVIILVLALPSITWLVYPTVGSPAALQPLAVQQASDGPRSMDEAIAMLRVELQKNPDNIEGWMLLGRSLLTMNQAEEAVSVYRKALTLAPGDPYIKMELGSAILRATEPNQQRGFPSEAKTYLEEAYAADPELQKAQWMVGIAAAAEGNHQRALELWEDLLPKIDPASNVSATIKQQISQSKSALGIEVTEAETAALSIDISVDESLSATLSPQAIVFVFLKVPGQSGIPLAVKRLPASQLPATLELTDADILQAGNKLLDYPELLLSAKLSTTGTADVSATDLQADTISINPASKTPISLILRAKEE